VKSGASRLRPSLTPGRTGPHTAAREVTLTRAERDGRPSHLKYAWKAQIRPNHRLGRIQAYKISPCLPICYGAITASSFDIEKIAFHHKFGVINHSGGLRSGLGQMQTGQAPPAGSVHSVSSIARMYLKCTAVRFALHVPCGDRYARLHPAWLTGSAADGAFRQLQTPRRRIGQRIGLGKSLPNRHWRLPLERNRRTFCGVPVMSRRVRCLFARVS
jgi:hypothetical protein